MEFLGDASALLQAYVFIADPFFFLFTRFDFSRAHVPSSDAALFCQGVVTKQEPPVSAVCSKQSCFEFKRVLSGKSAVTYGSHPLQIVRMNYPGRDIQPPVVIKSMTRIFPRDPICVDPFTVSV